MSLGPRVSFLPAMFCEHANESRQFCLCPRECYCRAPGNTCGSAVCRSTASEMRAPIVSFRALGKPATKGSWKIRRSRRGKSFLQADNEREKPWAHVVAWAAKEAMADRPLIDRGVEVAILFEFLRPAEPVRDFPTGDVDKLARSALDAMTGTIWVDDVLVVSLDVTKRYTARDPGARIHVYELGGRL